MRWTVLSTMALTLAACGGGERNTPSSTPSESAAAVSPTPPAASSSTAAAPSATAGGPGPTVEVKMTGNGSTKAAFEPNKLTISPGTTVHFVNVSGGAHNIAFWPDSIPAGAAAALNKGMPNQLTDLTGPFITKAGDSYDVSFAGAPAGVYKGYCQPHTALGMKITITVK